MLETITRSLSIDSPQVASRIDKQVPPTSPEDIIWRGFSPNAKLVGSALGFMGSGHMSIESLDRVVQGHTKNNPEATVDTQKGLEELRRVGVVKRDTLIESAQTIVAQYELNQNSSNFFSKKALSLREETQHVRYTVSLQLIQDFFGRKKDDVGFKEAVTTPRYALNPDYREFALNSLPKIP